MTASTLCGHSRRRRGRDRRHVIKHCAASGVPNPRHALRAAHCNGGDRQRRIGEAAASKSCLAGPPRSEGPPIDGRTAPRAKPAFAEAVEDRQRTFHPTDLFIVEVDRPSERRARTPFAIVAATEPAADRLALNLDFARLTCTSRGSNRHGVPPDSGSRQHHESGSGGLIVASSCVRSPPFSDIGHGCSLAA